MAGDPKLKERIAAMRAIRYRALKLYNLDLYRRTIEGAQAVILNHRLQGEAAVDCEAMAVLAVCDAVEDDWRFGKALHEAMHHSERGGL